VPRRSWPAIVEHATAIVESYDTGVTLRQLFYRLVSDGTLTNDQVAYKSLSHHTAIARRAGTFPDLIDQRRSIHRYPTWTSPQSARVWLANAYRRDRTEGQPVQLWLGVEKEALVEMLLAWFGDSGMPIIALVGFPSQTYVTDIRRAVERDGRPAVLLYAGDWDSSGESIEVDTIARTACWTETRRIALTEELVAAYGLPELSGKDGDSRAGRFRAKYGRLVQVELDALEPADLHGLYQAAIDQFWDESAFNAVIEQEARQRGELQPEGEP
jgi:hypothetical protein